VIVRQIRSAIRRFEFERGGLAGTTWLWLAVVASGLYTTKSGNGLAARRFGRIDGKEFARLVGRALALATGHLLATLLVLLPFSLLICARRMAAPNTDRREPPRHRVRYLQAGRPAPSTALAGYDRPIGALSFAVAIAHGAGLMLVPIYLGLCRASAPDKGHEAAATLMNAGLGLAALVSVVHATAMIAAGGCSAWLVYRYLGLKFVSRSWFNLDSFWAVSLILVGAIALMLALAD